MKDYIKKIYRVTKQTDRSNGVISLSQGERNYPIDEHLFNKFKKSIEQSDIFNYPSTNEFKQRVADYYDVEYDNVFIGAGSDVVIKETFEAFVDGGNVVGTSPSFPMYDVYAQMYNSEYITVPFKNFNIDVNDIIQSVNTDTKLIVISNPNSIYGHCMTMEELIQIIKLGVPTLVDEAYIEFSDTSSCISLINEYDNLIVTRTVSKALGSAGVRVGFLFSNNYYIEYISKLRHMYEVSSISIKWVDFLMNNNHITLDYIKKIKECRKSLIDLLSHLKIEHTHTNTNSILINLYDYENHIDSILKSKFKYLVKSIEIDESKYLKIDIEPNVILSDYIAYVILSSLLYRIKNKLTDEYWQASLFNWDNRHLNAFNFIWSIEGCENYDVIEVGSNIGIHTSILSYKFKNIYAIEKNKSAVIPLKENTSIYSNVNVYNGLISNFLKKFTKKRKTVIMLFDVIFMLYGDEFDEVLKFMKDADEVWIQSLYKDELSKSSGERVILSDRKNLYIQDRMIEYFSGIGFNLLDIFNKNDNTSILRFKYENNS